MRALELTGEIMSVLSDFVSAPAGAGISIAESVRPSDYWQVLEGWKGIDPVKLATLHALIAAEPLDVDSIVAKCETFEPVGGDGADGPWVMAFPDKIAQDIAALDPARVEATANAWAQTEELVLDGFTPDQAEKFILGLSGLCRSADAAGNKVYVWISL